jgi:translin
MVDKKLFAKLEKDYDSYDIGRRIIIKHSNDILKLSKQAIFALHRENVADAKKKIDEAGKELKYLETKIKVEKGLQHEGSYLAGVEEFVEAQLFYQFIKTGKVGEIKGYDIGTNSYLGGFSDLTGEIVRRAVYLATKRKYKEVAKCQQAIEEVVGQLIQLNLGGYLRTKFDQSKNSLRKIADIMYDLELKRRK